MKAIIYTLLLAAFLFSCEKEDEQPLRTSSPNNTSQQQTNDADTCALSFWCELNGRTNGLNNIKLWVNGEYWGEINSIMYGSGGCPSQFGIWKRVPIGRYGYRVTTSNINVQWQDTIEVFPFTCTQVTLN